MDVILRTHGDGRGGWHAIVPNGELQIYRSGQSRGKEGHFLVLFVSAAVKATGGAASKCRCKTVPVRIQYRASSGWGCKVAHGELKCYC